MATVYCKKIDANQVGFYLRVKGKDFFLCKQRYYKSLWDYFSGGADINSLFTKSGEHSHSIREVKIKLPAYVEYVEREEGVQVLKKTICKGDYQNSKRKLQEKRAGHYNWRNDNLAVI